MTYAQGAELRPDLVSTIVRRTGRVSPAFVKELMRRSVQFPLERTDGRRIESADVENALDEMLFRGGSLNLKVLGAPGAEPTECGCAAR